MTSRRLGLVLALLAGAQTIAAAGDLAALLPPTVARWVQLVVGAAGVSMAAWTGRTVATPADITPVWRR